VSESKVPRDAREVYLNDEGEPVAYCPKDGLGAVDLERAAFWNAQDKAAMRRLAERATVKSTDHETQFLVACIDVEDPTWRFLVDLLMPGADWQAIRDRGESPVARGVVPRELVASVLEELYPAALPLPPEPTTVVVFSAGGASAFDGSAP
jgi:hypothetical protein